MESPLIQPDVRPDPFKIKKPLYFEGPHRKCISVYPPPLHSPLSASDGPVFLSKVFLKSLRITPTLPHCCGRRRRSLLGMASIVCRVQFLEDSDPFICTNFPEPRRPPPANVEENLPLSEQISGIHSLLHAPLKVSPRNSKLTCSLDSPVVWTHLYR
ncbi:hypothetical protein NQZ68_040260 [Dissostichus eleginoides]|nr:hypothetical protein NQZ68_040260 [Dissostichus eleginoides]